jgi:hypothetical protein
MPSVGQAPPPAFVDDEALCRREQAMSESLRVLKGSSTHSNTTLLQARHLAAVALLEDDKAQLQSAVDAFAAELAAERGKFAAAEDARAFLEVQAEEMRARLRSVEQELHRAREDRADFDTYKARAKRKARGLERANKNLRDALAEMKRSLEVILATAQQAAATAVSLVESEKEQGDTTARLERELKTSRDTVNVMQHINLSLSSSVDMIKTQHAVLQARSEQQYHELQSSNKRLTGAQERLRQLELELREVNGLHDQTRANLARSEERSQELSRELARVRKNRFNSMEDNQTDGTAGVGLVLGERAPHRVIRIVPGGPCSSHHGGHVEKGDTVIEIDGMNVQATELSVVKRMLAGASGTLVKVTFHRQSTIGGARTYRLSIQRGMVGGDASTDTEARRERQSLPPPNVSVHESGAEPEPKPKPYTLHPTP